MNEEMEALYRNETWDITELPSGRKLIGCKWIYKTKYKSTGRLSDLKQVNKGWKLFQLDFNKTFFYGNLIGEVYITLPPGYFSVNEKGVSKELDDQVLGREADEYNSNRLDIKWVFGGERVRVSLLMYLSLSWRWCEDEEKLLGRDVGGSGCS
ncbi:putative RNA-directed DNA polymerase [Tanacetum coccineum]